MIYINYLQIMNFKENIVQHKHNKRAFPHFGSQDNIILSSFYVCLSSSNMLGIVFLILNYKVVLFHS